MAVLLKPLLDLFAEPARWELSAKLYLDALSDIPPDLLAKAVTHCIRTCDRFPKPATIRAAVSPETAELRRVADEHKRAKAANANEVVIPPKTQADFDFVDAVVAGWNARSRRHGDYAAHVSLHADEDQGRDR